MILLDTNLLGRITDSKDPQCGIARRAVQVLKKTEQLVIVPQNLYEFWSVATRARGAPPAGRNGLGMTTDQASQWLGFVQRQFSLLFDREDLTIRWHLLVKTLRISGPRSHDARLVAAMQSHGIKGLLTFNGDDFKNLPVTFIDPTSV